VSELVRAFLAILAWLALMQLGGMVSHAPPSSFDLSSAPLIGRDVPLAVFFTRSGTFPVYVVLCVAVLIVGFVWREWLVPAVISVITLIAAWRLSDLVKDAFGRPRMADWVAIHEASFSYPSGHAALSLTFYGLWIFFIARSRLPTAVRRALAALLVAWIAAIGWSRLALGAHYPTDLVGGYLLAAVLLCAAITVYYRIEGRPRQHA
jgi:undecaprenyl-diphosphatase